MIIKDKDLQEIFKKANFEYLSTIVDSDVTGTYIFNGKQEQKLVLLKVVPLSNQIKIEKQKREAFISKLLREKAAGFNFTNSIDYGQEGDYFWITRIFIEGKPLSSTSTAERGPLCHYDYLADDFINHADLIIPQIRSNIINLQLAPIRSADLDETFKVRYPQHILYNEKVKKAEHVAEFNFKQIIDFYSSKQTEYLAEENQRPCMGDLIPANIIIDSSNKLYFTDIEYFCLDNYTMDIALLWIYFWRYKDWQIQLTGEIPEQDKTFVRLSVIRILLPQYVEVFNSHDQEKILSYKGHGALNILRNIINTESL